jgi:AcrR family transcriptional regulator
MAAGSDGARRTQAERRAETRAALLDAAVDCLVAEGYARLTTRRIAERAGVSQGILMHYFPTKSTFLVEAIRHVAGSLVAEAVGEGGMGGLGEHDRWEGLLDMAWRIHTGATFQAGIELWSAARTDPALRDALRDLERDITGMVREVALTLLPQEAARPEFAHLVDGGLATLRGMAMLQPVTDPDQLEQRWQATKRLLLSAMRALELPAG